jgi:5-hydroxyisourate hydrolase
MILVHLSVRRGVRGKAMSQLTTHILDTTTGKPAPGITIVLYQQDKNTWKEVTQGTANNDGRISNLLHKDTVLEPGIYKLRFEVQEYFEKRSIQTFYPFVEITFLVTTNEHYHIPLLLSPFGYSTYRGS